MTKNPFDPHYGATVTAATAAGAVNVTVPAGDKSLLIVNASTAVVFIRVKPNGSVVDASALDMPMLPSSSRVIGKDGGDPDPQWGQTIVSVFCASAAGNVYVCPGEGYGCL